MSKMTTFLSAEGLLVAVEKDIELFSAEEYKRNEPQFYAERTAYNYWVSVFYNNQEEIPECYDCLGIFISNYYMNEWSLRESLSYCAQYLKDAIKEKGGK